MISIDKGTQILCNYVDRNRAATFYNCMNFIILVASSHLQGARWFAINQRLDKKSSVQCCGAGAALFGQSRSREKRGGSGSSFDPMFKEEK